MNEEEKGTGPATAVFVVRVWRDVSLSSGVRWYGRIERLDTKQNIHFSDLSTLNGFLQSTGLFGERKSELDSK